MRRVRSESSQQRSFAARNRGAGGPLVKNGPYRRLRHPNYWVVAAEIALLPLVFGVWEIALGFSAVNAVILLHRVRIEERELGL